MAQARRPTLSRLRDLFALYHLELHKGWYLENSVMLTTSCGTSVLACADSDNTPDGGFCTTVCAWAVAGASDNASGAADATARAKASACFLVIV